MNKNKVIFYISDPKGYMAFGEDLKVLRVAGDQVLWYSDMSELANALCEDAVLIECDSFIAKDNDPDICISYNEGWSFDPEITGIARQNFQESAYKVVENKTTSGCIAPECGCKYRAMKISVSTKVYSNGAGGLNSNPRQWMRWGGCWSRIITQLSEASAMPKF